MKKIILIIFVFFSFLIYSYFNKKTSTVQDLNETKQEENKLAFITNKTITPIQLTIRDNTTIGSDINITPLKSKNKKHENLTEFLLDKNNTNLDDDLPTEEEPDMEEINMAANMEVDVEAEEELLMSMKKSQNTSPEEIEENNDIKTEEIKNIINGTIESPPKSYALPK